MSEVHPTDFARQLELAWAAGFFDGEGSTHLSSKKKDSKSRSVVVSVSQVELIPLERFHAAIDRIGSIRGPYVNGKNREHSQPIYKWICAGFTAKKVLGLLWPYLSVVKREQADVAIAREVNSGRPAAATRTHCPQGHDYSVHGFRRESDNHRRCRICDRECSRRAQKKYQAKLKARKAQEAGADLWHNLEEKSSRP